MGQQGVAAPRPDEGSITVRRVTVETCSSWLVLLGDAGATCGTFPCNTPQNRGKHSITDCVHSRIYSDSGPSSDTVQSNTEDSQFGVGILLRASPPVDENIAPNGYSFFCTP